MDCDQTEAVGAGDGGMLVAAAVAVAVEEIAHEGVIWNKSLLSLLSFCGMKCVYQGRECLEEA